MITFTTKTFAELTPTELYDILKLRSEVFVVEQTCVFLDMDDNDQNALHVLGIENNSLVAYTRLVTPGNIYPYASIGRVVTSQTVRKHGYGKLLMKYSISEIQKKYHTNEIVIGAQTYLHKFYSELGFVKEGDDYLEDGIPHIKMRLVIK